MDDGLKVVGVRKVGLAKATSNNEVSIYDIVAGESLTLSGRCKGGPAGLAMGEARAKLSDADGGTLLE